MRPTPAPTCSRVDGGSWTSGQGTSLESAGRQPRRADTASEYDQPTLSTFECISRSLSDRMRTFPYAWPVVYPARKRDEKSSRMCGVSPMWTTSGREVRDTFLPGEEAPHGEGRIDGEGGSGDSATHPPAVFGRSELRNTLKSFIPRELLSVLSPCFPRRFPHCKTGIHGTIGAVYGPHGITTCSPPAAVQRQQLAENLVHITVIQDELFAPGRSKAARYAELVIGRSSFWALAKYELIVTSCAKVVRVS